MNNTVTKWFQYGFILLLGLVMIYPVLWMIAGSFNRIRQKSPILYRWVMNAVRYEGYRW